MNKLVRRSYQTALSDAVMNQRNISRNRAMFEKSIGPEEYQSLVEHRVNIVIAMRKRYREASRKVSAR